MLIGLHQSTAGGLAKAILQANKQNAIQIFTGFNMRWKDRPISPEESALFRQTLNSSPIKFVLSHAIYLINMATDDVQLKEQSRQALGQEIERCHQLSIQHFVVHPGSNQNKERGIDNIVTMIKSVLPLLHQYNIQLLLENMAGQGSTIGADLCELRTIKDALSSDLVNYCLDTCHLFAAGYDFSTAEKYRACFALIDNLLSIKNIKAIHLNNSKEDLGSKKDRHMHIDQGKIPLLSFKLLLNDQRLQHIPKLLETPKGDDDSLDQHNLQVLRSLLS